MITYILIVFATVAVVATTATVSISLYKRHCKREHWKRIQEEWDDGPRVL